MLEPWQGGGVVIGRRVVVVGTSGSGKTTLARRLARALGMPNIELDALHWAPNWTEVPDEVMRERVDRALRGAGWVVDGNYLKMHDIVWSRADTIVWLDFTLPVMFWRVSLRTFRRVVRRVELWHGNRESLRTALFSKDSIILWVLTTYKGRRRQIPELLAQPEHAHLKVVKLTTPRMADAWLERVRREQARATITVGT